VNTVASNRLDPDTLTPRQRRVLVLLGAGLREPQIARALDLHIGTIREHTRRAKRKLGARNLAQAFAIAWRSGLIR
jgi:DNA-binding CsgD family transcriptional regulator